MHQAVISLVKLGFITLNVHLNLLITILSICFDLFIKFLLEHKELVKVMLVASMDGTPLSTTSTEAFVVPSVTRLAPVDCVYSHIGTLALVTGFVLLSSVLRGLGFVLARLEFLARTCAFARFAPTCWPTRKAL